MGNESTELWKAAGAQVLGAPAISRGGQRIAFCVRVNGKARLYAMSADGSQLRVLADSLELQGSPSWTADGRAIISAAASRGVTRLFRVPIDESVPVAITAEYSTDPESSPDGSTLIYSGPDVGTSFALKAVDMRGTLQPLPSITLPRGSRHFAFVSDGRSILVLRGGIQHKDLWEINLSDGAQKRLTRFEPGFDVRDFDVSPDGRELIFEREQEHSDVVLLDLKR
jgi:Tol biopolymer transport system component